MRHRYTIAAMVVGNRTFHHNSTSNLLSTNLKKRRNCWVSLMYDDFLYTWAWPKPKPELQYPQRAPLYLKCQSRSKWGLVVLVVTAEETG